MKNFEFYNPVRIFFGKDQISKIALELKPYSKIMLVYGQGSIKRNGVYDRIMSVLGEKNIVEFSGVEPNPVYETLMKAVELAKKEQVDFLLAAGGGSVIDGTKFIAAAVKYKGEDPWEMLSKYAKVEDALPLGSVLTLPATGSEMNGGSVVTRKSCSEKLAFGSPLLLPKFSVLEPETMYSLPDIQIANGIVDAFVHITEQYLTYPMAGDVQDEWAASLLRVLIKNGPAVLQNRNDYDANANLMWAATMALNGLIAKGVAEDWSTHMIGHEITALYNIDHAQTLAIVLPGILRNRKNEKSAKILHYAKSVWGINSGNIDADLEEAIAKTESFFNSVGIKTRLSDYNIPESAIDIICKKLEDKKYVKLGENKNITPAVVKEVLRSRL
ncbi:MAG: iron-containing alcohol dehydrogenase [Bacteroidales bacterium]|nr:iron-containing alcohol dehydrogenase [Bacteroidales bacterium]